MTSGPRTRAPHPDRAGQGRHDAHRPVDGMGDTLPIFVAVESLDAVATDKVPPRWTCAPAVPRPWWGQAAAPPRRDPCGPVREGDGAAEPRSTCRDRVAGPTTAPVHDLTDLTSYQALTFPSGSHRTGRDDRQGRGAARGMEWGHALRVSPTSRRSARRRSSSSTGSGCCGRACCCSGERRRGRGRRSSPAPTAAAGRRCCACSWPPPADGRPGAIAGRRPDDRPRLERPSPLIGPAQTTRDLTVLEHLQFGRLGQQDPRSRAGVAPSSGLRILLSRATSSPAARPAGLPRPRFPGPAPCCSWTSPSSAWTPTGSHS